MRAHDRVFTQKIVALGVVQKKGGSRYENLFFPPFSSILLLGNQTIIKYEKVSNSVVNLMQVFLKSQMSIHSCGGICSTTLAGDRQTHSKWLLQQMIEIIQTAFLSETSSLRKTPDCQLYATRTNYYRLVNLLQALYWNRFFHMTVLTIDS